MVKSGNGYTMYWFKPIEIHSKRFRYLYTRIRGYAMRLCYKAILWVLSAIGQYSICHNDAMLCDMT